ncbi:MAG: phosphopantothenoylcysteine decarboxylase [Lachnospiraceae bacterium]
MAHILLGVTGSIAAYKAADLTSLLVKRGYEVEIIMTQSATAFITPLTLQTLSKNRVCVDMFEEKYPREVQHIALAKKADVFVVAPASADIIGKLSYGLADDLLTCTALAISGIPRLLAPAMNTAMYENPIVQENLARLQRASYREIAPRESLLACGDLGKGALADVHTIAEAVVQEVEKIK